MVPYTVAQLYQAGLAPLPNGCGYEANPESWLCADVRFMTCSASEKFEEKRVARLSLRAVLIQPSG